ncbi:MAG: glycosyltransferase [Segniliparus sp.]|uniref:glycosyltransferase n=1 Tax=Segniliparus sp. TaxID=2804064 RepID=UPI003F320C69
MSRGPGSVVFLSHTGAMSGAELAFVRLAAALGRLGLATSAVLTEAGPLSGALADAGVPTRVLATAFASRDVTIGGSFARLVRGGFHMLASGWTVGAAILGANGAVVVAESTKALLIGVVASRRARVPLVWHVHDRITREYFGWLAPVVRLIGFLAADGFVANSKGTLATLWTGRRPAVVSYPGVDLCGIPEPRAQRPAAEARLVMVGRLTKWKGQDLVLRALAQTTTQAPLAFVGGSHFGEDDYARSLRDLAALLQLADRVVFVGHTDDPLGEVARADVAIHYSRLAEPFGQVVVEAMAAGRAVIAAGAGGPEEIITDGVDGVLVPPRDPRALAEAIDRLVADAGLRASLAGSGAARARDFSLETVAGSAAGLLRQVAPRIAPFGREGTR